MLLENFIVKKPKSDYNTRFKELVNIINDNDIVLITDVQEIASILVEQLKRYANEPEKLQEVKDNIDAVHGLILAKDKRKGEEFLQMTNLNTDGVQGYKKLDTIEGIGTYQK